MWGSRRGPPFMSVLGKSLNGTPGGNQGLELALHSSTPWLHSLTISFCAYFLVFSEGQPWWCFLTLLHGISSNLPWWLPLLFCLHWESSCWSEMLLGLKTGRIVWRFLVWNLAGSLSVIIQCSEPQSKVEVHNSDTISASCIPRGSEGVSGRAKTVLGVLLLFPHLW